ncbi:MAG: ion channel [Chloroflexi bacterium]|nr:ion channel [Chloroflexota bacterium]
MQLLVGRGRALIRHTRYRRKRYEDEFHELGEPGEAARRTLRTTGSAMLSSALSTALGFGMLTLIEPQAALEWKLWAVRCLVTAAFTGDVVPAPGWPMATVTTVGYGNVVPVLTAVRVVAVVLMLVGIGLFGVLTASVAAWFVENRGDISNRGQLDRLRAEIRALRNEEKHKLSGPGSSARRGA